MDESKLKDRLLEVLKEFDLEPSAIYIQVGQIRNPYIHIGFNTDWTLPEEVKKEE